MVQKMLKTSLKILNPVGFLVKVTLADINKKYEMKIKYLVESRCFIQ